MDRVIGFVKTGWYVLQELLDERGFFFLPGT